MAINRIKYVSVDSRMEEPATCSDGIIQKTRVKETRNRIGGFVGRQ